MKFLYKISRKFISFEKYPKFLRLKMDYHHFELDELMGRIYCIEDQEQLYSFLD